MSPATGDKTWDMTITVRVATLGGWEPEASDIQSWLENGGLQLVRVEKMAEAS